MDSVSPSTLGQQQPREGWLLIVPGSSLIGVGIGLLVNRVFEGGMIGVGAGTLVWGLIVSLRRL